MISNFHEMQGTAAADGNIENNVIAIHQNKLLIPLRSKECGERVVAWLQDNPHLTKSQVMLLHVIEPSWLSEIPYSGIQALQMVQDHHFLVHEKQRLLQQIASTLHHRFPELKVSWQVRSAADCVESIVELAKEWNADCITFFSKPRRRFAFFSPRSISRAVMDRTDRTVQVIQESERSKSALLAIVDAVQPVLKGE